MTISEGQRASFLSHLADAARLRAGAQIVDVWTRGPARQTSSTPRWPERHVLMATANPCYSCSHAGSSPQFYIDTAALPEPSWARWCVFRFQHADAEREILRLAPSSFSVAASLHLYFQPQGTPLQRLCRSFIENSRPSAFYATDGCWLLPN